jgi:putative cardiolipin synthase
MRLLKYLLKVAPIVLIIFGCTSEPSYPPIDEDFCAQIHLDNTVGLSEALAPLSEKMSQSTAVYALEEGDLAMISRAWLTESAEQSIDIQYFIFSADNIGLIAIDYLLRAADRGVQVRLIVDDIMVEADADELLALDAHPNLSIKIYNPTSNIGKNLPQKLYSLGSGFKDFNQRMHNKTFIVDDQVVITGGRNIADEYFDYDHEYNFRDRDVLLIGKSVKEIKNSFDQYWDHELSVSVDELVDVSERRKNIAAKYEYVHQYACNPENFWPQVREKIKEIPTIFKSIQASGDLVWVDDVTFVSDLPGKNDGDQGLSGGGLSTDSLIALIQTAQERVYIQSPYLITTELSQQLFKSAIDRGVEIKILTNSMASTDNLEAFSGYKRDRQKLLDIGVEIYEFRPDSEIRFEIMTGALQEKLNFTPIFGLHAKSMVVDSETAVIGTFNLDPRSANLNTECIVIIRDDKVAGDLEQAMEADFLPGNAWRITGDYNPDEEAGWAKQFQVWTRGIVPKSVL